MRNERWTWPLITVQFPTSSHLHIQLLFSPTPLYTRQMFWWPSATHSPLDSCSSLATLSFATAITHFWPTKIILSTPVSPPKAAFGHWLCDSASSSCLPSSVPPSCVTFQWWALAVSILGGAMPPCEGDNDCYHECGEAEADGGHILWSDANEGRDGRWEEQHALTAQTQVQRKGMLVKYNCQHVVSLKASKRLVLLYQVLTDSSPYSH